MNTRTHDSHYAWTKKWGAGQCPLDAHAVLKDAIEDGPADLVVVGGPGFDVRGAGAGRLAAGAAGPLLAVGDIEEGDLHVGDGAVQAVVVASRGPSLPRSGHGALAGA